MSDSPTRFLRNFRFFAMLPVAIGCALLSAVFPLQGAAEPELFRFHHENILGTSLDLQVRTADAQQAAVVESAVLEEIERLRKILSTYDDASEISKLNASNTPVTCSQELIDVLTFYDWWTVKSKGSFNGQLGGLIHVWKEAEKAGAPPDASTLQPIVAKLGQPGWKIDAKLRTVTRLTAQPLNVNSLGKGYIISKAIVAARVKSPATQGILVNIGGDIFAYGSSETGKPWLITVANPVHSEDNAPPLTQVKLSNRAIATSAAYERGYNIAGKHYSHIFNPRTGLPAEGISSATVIAPNSANANALATTLCVLKPEEGLALVKQIADAECLIVTADGRQIRSARFADYEVRAQPVALVPTATPDNSGVWPKGYQLTIDLTLKTPTAPGPRGVKRPYVAAWVQNADGKYVRTIALWSHPNKPKYLPTLKQWWQIATPDAAWAATVSRATRSAGHHRLLWDGLDDHGAPLPRGSYTVFLEVIREGGGHSSQSAKIECGSSMTKAVIPAASEFDEAQITYGLPLL